MKSRLIGRCAAIIAASLLAGQCSRTDDRSHDVEVPRLEKGCLSGECVKGQFVTAYQRFSLVTGNGVNLRSRPDMTSRVLAKLPVTRKIIALHVNPEEVVLGGLKGRWAFVRDATNLNLTGWIFDRFVGYRDNFRKVSGWKIREIRVILGGRLTVYRCSADGRFEVTQSEMIYRKDGAGRREKISGEIFERDSVIWLKRDGRDDHPVFFYRAGNGKLELPDQYREMRGIIMTR